MDDQQVDDVRAALRALANLGLLLGSEQRRRALSSRQLESEVGLTKTTLRRIIRGGGCTAENAALILTWLSRSHEKPSPGARHGR